MNTRAYYQAALMGLRFVEARQTTGRRFGPDADARWSSFAGDLTASDRLDLLLRDADAQWPSSFGARSVFDLRAVADDEAFGADWESLDAVDANELWRSPEDASVAADATATLEAAASAWGLTLSSMGVGDIQPADRLVVVGPAAIAATASAFAAGTDLDWSDQVVCVATPPAHRQLASLSAALLNSGKPTDLRSATATANAGPSVGHRLIHSADADAADLEAARIFAGV